ncbi:MAG: hypothetical protein BGO67_08165 [Alphaproteobacteria bacterium 41-28]|nr:MAG: hypothetical protein BGO67_08165 [Alphaproteobacteria bacterium 41-28]
MKDSTKIPNASPSRSFSNRFQDKVVLITGGTSGIGLATAVKFAEEGAGHVVVCGRNKSKWTTAQDYIKRHLTEEQIKKIEYIPCDVRVESQVKEMIEHMFTKFGRLDICFNNAGVQPGEVSAGGDITKLQFESLIGEDGSILFRLPPPQPTSPHLENEPCKTCDPSQTTKVSPFCESPLATSIIGIFYSLKWEIAYAFEKQPKNLPMAIINTSSRNGIIPDPHRPLYAGAKAFIISITKSLSNQVAQRSIKEKRVPIRINAIAPGPVDTPLERAAFPGSDAEFRAKASVGVPMERVAQPEEIAPVVLFLADEKVSGYITGADVPVDGGDVASPLMRAP